ncbi:MAG TPA: BamA/TamA family outer membrane protein [Kofleriaceae bacterium]|jgi:hypothetical protein
MRLVQSVRAAAVAGILLIARGATGQPVASTDPRPASSPGADRTRSAPPVAEQPQPPQRHSARSVAGAPRPDGASGVARPEPEPGGTRRAVARGVLVLPRIAFWALNAPIRAGYWVSERYQVPARARETFFNQDGTAGVVPIAWAGTDTGAGGGGRFLHRDLLGRGEHLVVDARYGGRVAPGAALWLDSGERLGDRLRVRVDGRFEDRPRDRFFGIGNADEVTETVFHQRVAGARGMGEARVAGPLAVQLSSEVRWRSIDPATEPVDAVAGFGEERSHSYHQLEAVLDTRDRPSRSEPPGPRATGLALSAFAGAATGPAYGRFGGEARAQLPLGTTQRILVLRALAEGVSGPLGDIPFVDLPQLGGALLLRGYPADRFRDRAMALTSAEYRFDLSDSLGAFLFADAGRVLAEPGDPVDGGLRAGYGGGLDLRRGAHPLGRFTLASSIDGGFFASAVFDPMGEPEEQR